MKLNCRIIILTAAALTMWACSNSHENKKAEQTDTDSSFHKKATILKVNGGAPEEYIALQKKAVEEMRQGKAKESSSEILAQMGYFYFRSGDYLQALTYLQEAADSMRNIPLNKIDIEAGTKLLGNTANLYTEMSMYNEAMSFNTKALKLCEQGDNTRIPDLLRMRAMIFEKNNKLDSAAFCLQKAIKASENVKDKELAEIGRLMNEKAYAGLFIEHPDYKPDSIAMAVNILERNLKLLQKVSRPTSELLIGRGYVLMGNTTKGIKMMEDALKTFRQNYGTDDIEWALRIYTQSLLETELSPKSLAIYKESKRMTDTVTEYSKANALLGADFKYRTTHIKNEKIQLANLLKQKQEKDIYKGILSLFTVIAIVFFTIMRIRRKNKIISDNKKAIDRLIKDRISLNAKIEEFNQNECKSQYGVEDSNASSYSEILTMVLLTKEDETKFRQLFDSIFPGYIQRLRRDYPKITPTTELICMLIRLSKSNEEIALTLGIKRESVVKSRYRLRSLFKLDKETDLNDFIASI